jgi:hypothetical protein
MADAGTEASNSPAEAPQGHEMRRAGKNYVKLNYITAKKAD